MNGYPLTPVHVLYAVVSLSLVALSAKIEASRNVNRAESLEESQWYHDNERLHKCLHDQCIRSWECPNHFIKNFVVCGSNSDNTWVCCIDPRETDYDQVEEFSYFTTESTNLNRQNTKTLPLAAFSGELKTNSFHSKQSNANYDYSDYENADIIDYSTWNKGSMSTKYTPFTSGYLQTSLTPFLELFKKPTQNILRQIFQKETSTQNTPKHNIISRINPTIPKISGRTTQKYLDKTLPKHTSIRNWDQPFVDRKKTGKPFEKPTSKVTANSHNPQSIKVDSTLKNRWNRLTPTTPLIKKTTSTPNIPPKVLKNTNSTKTWYSRESSKSNRTLPTKASGVNKITSLSPLKKTIGSQNKEIVSKNASSTKSWYSSQNSKVTHVVPLIKKTTTTANKNITTKNSISNLHSPQSNVEKLLGTGWTTLVPIINKTNVNANGQFSNKIWNNWNKSSTVSLVSKSTKNEKNNSLSNVMRENKTPPTKRFRPISSVHLPQLSTSKPNRPSFTVKAASSTKSWMWTESEDSKWSESTSKSTRVMSSSVNIRGFTSGKSSTKRNRNTTPMPNINSIDCGCRGQSYASTQSRNSGQRNNIGSGNVRYRQTSQRIVGGEEVEPYSWPWVAALYKVSQGGGNRFLSAGSLINKYYVLTAAHVFTPDDLRTSSYVVMLGTHNVTEAIVEYLVSYILQHPQYEHRYYYNDIALLKLGQPVMFSEYVMPVCLPSPDAPLLKESDLIGKRVTVMGWGDDSFGGRSSLVLKEATFPIVSRKSCNESYIRVASNRFPRGITEEMLCAGSPNGGKDACQGDSGGPLTRLEDGRYTQVGIVSFGFKCGDKEYPGVYTKVAYYLGWIAENSR